MTNLQLAAIISQAMYVGSVHSSHKDKEDFDEIVFRNYARGMMNVILRSVCMEDESAVEKALEDFLTGFEI
jgi:hypothetical protein